VICADSLVGRPRRSARQARVLVVRGPVAVTALNLRTPAPEDPDYRIQYPASNTAGYVKIRLILRGHVLGNRRPAGIARRG
jgi:hypothetical protein